MCIGRHVTALCKMNIQQCICTIYCILILGVGWGSVTSYVVMQHLMSQLYRQAAMVSQNETDTVVSISWLIKLRGGRGQKTMFYLPQSEVFFLSLHRPNNCLENIYIFHLLIFNSVLKKLFSSRKNIEGWEALEMVLQRELLQCRLVIRRHCIC